MSAGLPGVGLSGLFFIASALLMVPLELVRTLRGRSSLARWATVLRHFATAVLMIGALELFYLALRFLVSELSHLAGGADRLGPARHIPQMVPLLPVLATAALVLTIVLLAKGAELCSRAAHNRSRARLATEVE
jgi:hypothetical protein